jgi:hypothetical protein
VTALSSALIKLARQDSAVFAAVAGRDEQTGAPFELTTHHKGYHRLWNSATRTTLCGVPEGGKSAHLVAYAAWRIGRDPGIRIGYLSATVQQAQRHLRALAIILSSPGFARVFPGLRVDSSTADHLTISPRPETIKDVTCLAGAFDLSSMLGARLDLVLCDDVITREQANSQAARDRAYADFIAVTSSRVAPSGEIHCVGTAEHPDDLLHRLSRLPGWLSAKFAVLSPDGSSAWPERWPLPRIEARRLELGPVRFMATMLCEASSEAALCFRQQDLDKALANGLAAVYSEIPQGRCIVACDPAWTSRPGADESGIVMVLIDETGFRHLTLIEGWRVPHEVLVNRLVELGKLNRATVYVESNGAGELIADAVSKRTACKGLSTSRQSKESRVEALSAELASGRWVFRQAAGEPGPDLQKLLSDMATFSFDRHCGDRLAALLIAVEGVRALENRPKAGWIPLTRSDGGIWRAGSLSVQRGKQIGESRS